MRNKFSFYASYLEAIDTLPDDQQLQLYKAIAHYALQGEEPTNLTGIAKACFPLIKPNIDSDNRRYDANTRNGSMGGRPNETKTENNPRETQPEPKLETPKNPSITQNNPNESEIKPNENPNITQGITETKPKHNPHQKPNEKADIERDIESKKTDNRNLDKESDIMRADLQSLTKKFNEAYPLRDVTIPASLVIPQKFNGQLMLDKLQQSTWLRTHDNLGLAWCIKNYERIINDAYKDDEPKIKSAPGAIHTRKYTKEENESILKQFDNMEI